MQEHRDEEFTHIREMARQNEESMRGFGDKYRRSLEYTDSIDKENGESEPTSTGTFFIRLFLSVVILGGFLWNHLEGRQLWGYSSEQVIETLSRDVNLQDFTDSVKIDKKVHDSQ